MLFRLSTSGLLTLALPFFVLGAKASAVPLVECEPYVRGLANPNITRFGGLRPTTPIQDMANLFLDHVPTGSASDVQVAMPVHLEYNPAQPQEFGDGQMNGYATYGVLAKTPYIAVLTRSADATVNSDLILQISKDMPGFQSGTPLEFSIAGQSSKLIPDAEGRVRIPVDLKSLGWDGLYHSQPVYFRPAGWNDWFAVQFPNPYVSIEKLVGGMRADFQKLPTGQSVVDPLGVAGSANIQSSLRQLDESKFPDFALARKERTERVHGIYQTPDNRMIPTSTGGVWTRYRLGDPFKVVYLGKDPRVVDIEEQEGVVSGTGPHFIGAKAEIILNSLGQGELMTLYGVSAPATTPDGHPMAYGLSHQWVGTWLKPGQAFVTPFGMYHWHLNHLASPIGAEVFTPPDVPGENNHYGFPKGN